MGTVPAISGAIPTPSTASAKSVFDARIIEVDITFALPPDANGVTPPGPPQTISLSNANGNQIGITAVGSLFGSAAQSQCEIRIYNLDAKTRNLIITKTSPLQQPQANKTRPLVTVTLKVGRKSYGTFLLFTGNVIFGGITQPPDIAIILRSLTSNFFNGVILGFTQPPNQLLSTISLNITKSFNPPLTLNFLASDKMINNFCYSGSTAALINELENVGNLSVTNQNGVLTVVNANAATPGNPVIISKNTGMVGIPQVTEQGVTFTCLVNPAITLLCSVKVVSELNPAVAGDSTASPLNQGVYKVIKLNFEISTRDTPFWYIVETSNLALYDGTTP